MNGVTNIDDGPKGSWTSRNCPGPREYARSWLSFNGPWQTITRRFCMWAIIILRTVMNVLAIAFKTLGSKVAGIVCGVLAGIFSFVFVFWCLTMIDRAHGRRACWFCGLLVGRTHLDVFIGVNALLHLGLMASFRPIIVYSAVCFNIIWFCLLILTGVYGILCTKPPVPCGSD